MEKTLLSKPEITIQNVVATGSLNHAINLDDIVKAFPNVEWRPQVFPGLVFRLKRPKTTTLIFTTGKMVCTGAKSEKESKRAIRKVVRELKREGIIITGKPEIKIQNIVASVDLGDVYIEVEDFIYAVDRIMYEPDQFPGAIYRMEEPRCVFLIFSTGKLVCVGATREEDVYKAVENIVTILDDAEVLIRKEKVETKDD
ncbi:MAG: TATA box-binding protein [Candidatus Bathyarchaeota archaeon]